MPSVHQALAQCAGVKLDITRFPGPQKSVGLETNINELSKMSMIGTQMNEYGNAVCDILRKRGGSSEWKQIYSEWLQLHNFTKHYICDITL